MERDEGGNRRTAMAELMRFVKSPEQIAINANGELTGIQLFQSGITDREMTLFQHFTEIESLSIGECSGVTDSGLRCISDLRKLTFLDLQDTGVTDAGLAHLSGLVNLRTLDLNNLPITDSGIRHLEGLTKLQKLVLNEDGISNEAYERLLAAIPGLVITNY